MNKMHNILLLFAAALLLLQANCKLQVLQYPQNKQLISFNNPIEYSIANFGEIPYGTKSVAPLLVADPLDACTPLVLPQQVDEFNQTSNQQKIKQLEAPFILIERGNCHFTQKAMVAQAAGAKMAIIVDNQFDDLNTVILADDGFGDNVYIPTIFISQKDGQDIISVYNEQNPVSNQVYDFFQLAISFDVQQTDIVDLKLFINPPFQGNYQLLNKFFSKYSYLEDLEKKGKLIITPVYQIFKSNAFGNIDQNADCIRNGRYCTYDQDGPLAGTGKDLVNEYLYQICVQKVEGTKKWWNYIKYLHKNCNSIKNFHSCAQIEATTKKFDDAKIKECMYNDYSNEFTDQDHALLEQQVSTQQKANVQYFPSVTINNVMYRGSVNGEDVLEAVCATFSKPSSKCQQYLKQTQNKFDTSPNSTTVVTNGPNVTLIIVVVLGVLVLFFLFMMFVYRRMVAKDMQKEMNAEVNQIVSQYIAFSESNKKGGQLSISQSDDF